MKKCPKCGKTKMQGGVRVENKVKSIKNNKNSKLKLLAFILFFLFYGSAVYPDASSEIFMYKVDKNLSYVEIRRKNIMGAIPGEYLEKHNKELKAQGIYQEVWDGGEQEYINETKIDGLKIKTILTMYPSTGRTPSQNVKIYINGNKKVDCSIGINSTKRIVVDKVVLHTTPQYGLVEILAYTDDGKILKIPFEHQWFSNSGVITDEMLIDDTV